MTPHFSQIPSSKFQVPKCRGFTLVEILVVGAILALIGAAAIISFRNSRATAELDAASRNLLSILGLAQARTLAGDTNSRWGVKLETDRYTLFRGSSFAGSDANQIFLLPQGIEISQIALSGGGSEVVFQKITGKTAQSGILTLRQSAGNNTAISLTIDPSGRAYRSTTSQTPTNSRIIDSRHRTFDLGWSIKNSSTLALVFSDPPNPDTIQNITMASYFDAAKTKFDWSGSFAIGAQTQSVRIHALSLTDSATALSIDRDCRENTKKLAVSVDNKLIATYEADCATIAVGAFGGMMSEP